MKTVTRNVLWLSDEALNWAVSAAIGEYSPMDVPAYSTDWAHGGPIIERERLCLGYRHQADLDYSFLLPQDAVCWARATDKEIFSYGSTPLIAAMRCYVISKLGDEVQIPEALK